MTLEWTPQQQVWIALAISAAALIVCLGLVLWPRRRRDRAHDDDGEARAATLDGDVEYASPLVATGATPTRRAVIGAALAAGLVAAILTRWWVGLVVAVCVFAVLVRPRLRVLLTGGAVACVAATGLYVFLLQQRHGYPYEFFWVEHFGGITNVAWLAVLLLAADALVEVVRRRSAAPR